MEIQSDKLISNLTVRIKSLKTNLSIGTGVIYYNKKLEDKVYVLTAAHCLFEDSDKFEDSLFINI